MAESSTKSGHSRGIINTILAPTPYKKKVEREKLDPDTHLPMLDAYGKVIMEEKEIQIPFYKPVKVFDVSQTVGDPLPQLVSDLTGDVQQYEVFMEALKRTSPVPISIEKIPEKMDGFFNADTQSITLREGMSQIQTVCAAIHEIAHSILHNEKLLQEMAAVSGEPVQKKDRNTEEIEAESVAYSVSAFYGLDTGANSLGYILEWSKTQELSELRASLETIRKTASSLITDIDRHFDAICKERGIDRNIPEAETQEVPDSPDRFAADFCAFLNQAHQDGAIPIPFAEDAAKMAPKVAGLLKAGSFESLRQTLSDAAVISYNIETVNSLLERLDAIQKQWEAAIVYHVESYPLSTGNHNRCCIIEDKPLEADRSASNHQIVYVGSEARCQEITEELNNHRISVEKVKAMEREEPAEQDDYAQPLETETGAETSPDRDGLERETSEPPQEPAELDVADPAVSVESMNAYGYVSEDMLPLTKDRAKEIFEHDGTVYMLYEGNSEGMVYEPEDIEMHSGLFGISREDWEAIKDEIPPAQEQEKPQEMGIILPDSAEVEARFRANPADAFLIYQLKLDESTHGIMFEPFSRMVERGKPIDYANYDAVYTGALPERGDVDQKLEQLFEQFNIAHPSDFRGHSLSISDIVAIKQGNDVSCYHVDNIGFKPLPEFLPSENYLKNAEMSLEDDYGMIDGIINNGPKQPTVADLEQQVKSGQSISLLELAEAQKREERARKKPASKSKEQMKKTKEPPKKARKPSVLEKLRHFQNLDKQQKIERKSAERGL